MATKKSSSKKSTNSVKAKRGAASRDLAMSTPVVTPTTPVSSLPLKKPVLSPKITGAALIIVIIALLTYKFGPWLVPAVVDGKPVSRFGVWQRMEKSYGEQTLDDMVNEMILDRAIEKSGVKVEQSAIEAQLADLETQFESLGGLDAALEQRGLTKAELEKQIVTQLSVEQILADKVSVDDAAVQTEYDTNKDTLYKDKKFDEVKDSIRATLKDSLLRDAFLTWFGEIKKEANVKNFGL